MVTQKYHSKRDVAKIGKREMETKFPKKVLLLFLISVAAWSTGNFLDVFFFLEGQVFGNKLHASDRVEGHRTPKKHHQKRLMGVSPRFSFFLEGVVHSGTALVLEDQLGKIRQVHPARCPIFFCSPFFF